MKLTRANMLHGNKMASYSGYKKGKGVIDPKGKPKYTPELSKDTKIDRSVTEEAVFYAENTDMRGKKNKLDFRGNHPVRWNPQQDFNPNMSGDRTGGGAFHGGRLGVKAGKKKDYQQAFGDVNNTTRPFAPGKVSKMIKLKT